MSAIEIVGLLALVGYAVYRQSRRTEVVGRSRFALAIVYGSPRWRSAASTAPTTPRRSRSCWPASR